MVEPSLSLFEATTHSAISVVNAIPAGKGVTIAIDIPCTVRASFVKRKNNERRIKVLSKTSDPHALVEKSVEYAFSHLRADFPKLIQLRIQINSKIPTAVGLKSSSAVSVATTKAVFGLFSKDSDWRSILKSSCTASKDSMASVTGAYDDASASLLGGLAFTDNYKFKLVKHSKVPKKLGSKIAILVPKKRKMLTSNVNAISFEKYHVESLHAFDLAMLGDFASAMLLNSIIQCATLRYSMRPVSSALEEGASAAGITGKGPAVGALCQNSKIVEKVKRKWLEENENCNVLTTTVLQPAKIIE
ncbi:MAG TPA: shikimate kinase [Nitrososphaerales archaeon]|nr:shikimate kinase [Nitrososphaerales archaeon]